MRLALLLAIASLGFGGCSALQRTEAANGLDHEKMSAVEQQAQRSGVRVFWVNPPRMPGG
jgi:hypothetical protein